MVFENRSPCSTQGQDCPAATNFLELNTKTSRSTNQSTQTGLNFHISGQIDPIVFDVIENTGQSHLSEQHVMVAAVPHVPNNPKPDLAHQGPTFCQCFNVASTDTRLIRGRGNVESLSHRSLAGYSFV